MALSYDNWDSLSSARNFQKSRRYQDGAVKGREDKFGRILLLKFL